MSQFLFFCSNIINLNICDALVVVLGIQALSFKEATSRLFAIFIMKLKRFSHQLNFKNNGPVLFFKTIFMHRNCLDMD